MGARYIDTSPLCIKIYCFRFLSFPGSELPQTTLGDPVPTVPTTSEPPKLPEPVLQPVLKSSQVEPEAVPALGLQPQADALGVSEIPVAAPAAASGSKEDPLLRLLEGAGGDNAPNAGLLELEGELKVSISKAGATPQQQAAPEGDEERNGITSKTHRAAYMRLSRFMESDSGPEFPHMQELWNGNSKQRLELLRTWVTREENRDACESAVVMSREDKEKYRALQRLMSVKDMVKAGLDKDKIKAIIHRGGGVPDPDAPDNLMLTQFWVTQTREREKEAITSTRSETRVRAATDVSVYEAPLEVPRARAPHTYIGEVQQLLQTSMAQVDPTAAAGGRCAYSFFCGAGQTGASAVGTNQQEAGGRGVRPKKKAKAKPKAGVNPTVPLEGAELKASISALKDVFAFLCASGATLKKEMTLCNNVVMDLPVDNTLRKSIGNYKDRYDKLANE